MQKILSSVQGASHRKLGVPGERELAGMGVSYCATCDGAFFRGRTVAVVGGGDVAVGDALFLARGCEKVYLIHRRDELRAAKEPAEEINGSAECGDYLGYGLFMKSAVKIRLRHYLLK